MPEGMETSPEGMEATPEGMEDPGTEGSELTGMEPVDCGLRGLGPWLEATLRFSSTPTASPLAELGPWKAGRMLSRSSLAARAATRCALASRTPASAFSPCVAAWLDEGPAECRGDWGSKLATGQEGMEGRLYTLPSCALPSSDAGMEGRVSMTLVLLWGCWLAGDGWVGAYWEEESVSRSSPLLRLYSEPKPPDAIRAAALERWCVMLAMLAMLAMPAGALVLAARVRSDCTRLGCRRPLPALLPEPLCVRAQAQSTRQGQGVDCKHGLASGDLETMHSTCEP